MPIMEWNSDLDVGVEAMNDEHKHILDLMNRIHDASAAGQTGAPVIRLVDELAQVTIDHFRDEEAYMEKTGYDGLKTHALIHKDLLEKYTGYAADIRAANGVLPEKFLLFLKLWLTAHIKGIDMKYGPKADQLKKAG